MMVRLLLKVLKVRLRLKEKVKVQTLIRCNEWHFCPHCAPTLENSEAIFNSHVEFFMPPQQAKFEIHVMLLHGEVRKSAGVCEVVLQNWEPNHCNWIQTYLKKSPDREASISFDFIYMQTDIPSMDKAISAKELELLRKKSDMEEMESQNTHLLEENSRLAVEIECLKKENTHLHEDQKHLEAKCDKQSSEMCQELQLKKEQVMHEQGKYAKVRERLEEMMEIANEFGEGVVRAKLKDCYDKMY